MKLFLKYVKIIGLVLCIVFGIIGGIILIVFFKKDKQLVNKDYLNKINELLQEKKKDEEIINNHNIDNYNKNGTIK